ncbi:MAG: family N-acetyltransferase [Caulobacter sp.]|jgi:ribosomal-protein-alanine N-acetyltransferase|nr:family N-acetyltransferase [Caulobacter sp.]
MILETERLTLTPITAEDRAFLYPIMADPEVMAHWDSDVIDDPDVIDAILEGQIQSMGDGIAWYWSMRLTGGGGFVGSCDLSDIDWRHHRAEVGFIMGKDAWGQGYAIEAMRAVMAFAASQGLKRLWARTHVGNTRSDNLLQKLGFEAEGYMRGHIDRDGERRDVRLWGMLL